MSWRGIAASGLHDTKQRRSHIPRNRTVLPNKEHAAYSPQDQLCLCWEIKVPAHKVYRGVDQGCNAKNRLLIAFEVGESVVAESWHWSLEGCNRYLRKSLHVQGPTWAQVVDEVQRCLFVQFPVCTVSLCTVSLCTVSLHVHPSTDTPITCQTCSWASVC